MNLKSSLRRTEKRAKSQPEKNPSTKPSPQLAIKSLNTFLEQGNLTKFLELTSMLGFVATFSIAVTPSQAPSRGGGLLVRIFSALARTGRISQNTRIWAKGLTVFLSPGQVKSLSRSIKRQLRTG